MHRTLPTIFQRLRRHKGGWMLLIAALVIKIAAGTACVLDGPGFASAAPVDGYTAVLDTAQANVGSADVGAAADNADACLLGEGSDCHCACAHAAALPTTAPAVATVVRLPEVVSHLPAAPVALATRSPLRPPIA